MFVCSQPLWLEAPAAWWTTEDLLLFFKINKNTFLFVCLFVLNHFGLKFKQPHEQLRISLLFFKINKKTSFVVCLFSATLAWSSSSMVNNWGFAAVFLRLISKMFCLFVCLFSTMLVWSSSRMVNNWGFAAVFKLNKRNCIFGEQVRICCFFSSFSF